MADGAFIENCAKSFKDCGIAFGSVFSDVRPDFARKAYSNFDGVVCGALKEEDKNFKGDN